MSENDKFYRTLVRIEEIWCQHEWHEGKVHMKKWIKIVLPSWDPHLPLVYPLHYLLPPKIRIYLHHWDEETHADYVGFLIAQCNIGRDFAGDLEFKDWEIPDQFGEDNG